MAHAFCCDRCGKFYQHKKIVKDDKVYFHNLNLTTDEIPLVVWDGKMIHKDLNLCPDCIRDFIQFMNMMGSLPTIDKENDHA